MQVSNTVGLIFGPQVFGEWADICRDLMLIITTKRIAAERTITCPIISLN